MWSALLGRGFRGGLFGLSGPTNSKRFIEASTLLRALRGLVTYISTLPRRASARRRVSALYKTFTVLVGNLASAYSKSLIFFTEYAPPHGIWFAPHILKIVIMKSAGPQKRNRHFFCRVSPLRIDDDSIGQ